jgi:hypothetical protein
MKLPTKFLVFSVSLFLVVLGVWYSNRLSQTSSAFPLSLATLEQTHDGRIASFEERRGNIFVHLVDRFGDGHIHLLNHEGVSEQKALEILKAKQQELERARAEPGGAANRGQPVGSETNRTSAAAGPGG